MRQRSITRAMLAGFMATLAMTFLGFFATHFGVPYLNWAKMMTGFFHGNAIVGYFVFFVAGVILSVLYVHLFHDRLPGTSWKRGLFFATIMWLITGAALAPLMHMGFFMGGIMMAFGTLVTYLLYGAILGFIYDA